MFVPFSSRSLHLLGSAHGIPTEFSPKEIFSVSCFLTRGLVECNKDHATAVAAGSDSLRPYDVILLEVIIGCENGKTLSILPEMSLLRVVAVKQSNLFLPPSAKSRPTPIFSAAQRRTQSVFLWPHLPPKDWPSSPIEPHYEKAPCFCLSKSHCNCQYWYRHDE